MKREIKFRAWDKKNNCWYKPIFEAFKGRLYELLINFSGQLDAHTIEDNEVILKHESLFPDRYELMQFTGLKDKNGKEIYEGDVVNMVYDEPYNRPHIIIWHINKFCAIHLSQYLRGNDYNDPKLPNGFNAEVIGNIFENSELLK